MKHIWLIGLKDVKLAFRDSAALIMMLAAPFLLTLGMGFATGSFGSEGDSGLADIPVAMVDLDGGTLAETLLDVLHSEELEPLVELQEVTTVERAKQLVDEDQVAAAVVIPAGFSDSIIPPTAVQPSEGGVSEVVLLEIYINPNSPTRASVIQTIIEQFLSRVETSRLSNEVSIRQLLESGLLSAQDLGVTMSQRGDLLPNPGDETLPIQLVPQQRGGEGPRFNALAFMAPGMALLFLMYTVSYGGRSILIERQLGTLPRLQVAPITPAEILGGKVMGIFLTGSAQMLILIVSCTLLFRLEWGDPLGVVALILAAVYGASGWGVLLTALARTPGQVSSIGSALMLSFGILGGSFINLDYLPAAVQWISKITPNAWGMDGFNILALGGGLPQLVTPIVALLGMGTFLFAGAVYLFNRNSST